jgi:hypothetical protein
MKYDYTVMDIYGHAVSCTSFAQAVREGKKMVRNIPDCDPIIDQYYKDDELTGKYWKFDGKDFITPPTLAELAPNASKMFGIK